MKREKEINKQKKRERKENEKVEEDVI